MNRKIVDITSTNPSEHPRGRRLDTVKLIARIAGLSLIIPFFLWLLLGLVPGIPSIVDVFGMAGLRTPTAFVIAGLMLAAFGYEDF